MDNLKKASEWLLFFEDGSSDTLSYLKQSMVMMKL